MSLKASFISLYLELYLLFKNKIAGEIAAVLYGYKAWDYSLNHSGKLCLDCHGPSF